MSHALDDGLRAWEVSLSNLLQRDAEERLAHARQAVDEHMASLERCARYWPRKDRAKRLADWRAFGERCVAEGVTTASALPDVPAREGTGQFVVHWNVSYPTAAGRTLVVTMHAPDGRALVRFEVAAEPLAIASRALVGQLAVADALNDDRTRQLASAGGAGE